MQRSRFHTVCGVHAQAALLAAAVVTAPSVMAKGPLETIFSAENALYGAGYDIGRADGWIDQRLRGAIRKYQSEQDELTVSGNLDPGTLKALGVHSSTDQVISQNAVANRSQALAALNLQKAHRPAPAPKPVDVARPEPAPEPEPEVAAAAAEPAAVPVGEPAQPAAKVPEPEVVSMASGPAPDSQPEAEAAPEVAAEIADKEKPSSPEKQPDIETISKKPEVNPDRESAVREVAAVEAEPVPRQTGKTPAPSGAPDTSQGDSEVVASLPAEPTAAGPATPARAAEAPRTQSSGGFFSSLFDFLFGWLV
ncbi:MAG: peptidoglycan-binding protein [Pseudomonadota bacterium]